MSSANFCLDKEFLSRLGGSKHRLNRRRVRMDFPIMSASLLCSVAFIMSVSKHLLCGRGFSRLAHKSLIINDADNLTLGKLLSWAAVRLRPEDPRLFYTLLAPIWRFASKVNVGASRLYPTGWLNHFISFGVMKYWRNGEILWERSHAVNSGMVKTSAQGT